jgi:serine/threonine protein kinase
MPRPQLTEITTRAVAQQILGLAEAFNAAHNLMSGNVRTGASYRHGDLKPANILWFKPKGGETKDVIGTLKICDWGEAKNKTSATVMRHSKTTADFGTRRYQPPEVDTGIHLSIAGEPKRRSRLYDMWAMGCITLEIIVWLLYGEMGLEKFRKSLRNELNDGSPFYQTNCSGDGDKNYAWVHNVVDHWMRHMAQDAACRAGTTILGGLLEIVETGLLIVKLPAGGGTYIQEVRPPSNNLAKPPQVTSSQEPHINYSSRFRHVNITLPLSPPETTTDNQANDVLPDDPVVNVVPPDEGEEEEEEEDVQPKFLFGGNSRMRADQLRDRILELISDDDVIWSTESNSDVPNIPGSLYSHRPTHDVSRRLQEHEVDYGKTSIDTEQWKFKVDKEFAQQLFNRIEQNVDFPKPRISTNMDLCETCQKLRDGIWSFCSTTRYDVQTLEYRAQQESCDLCMLLWGSIGQSGAVFPTIDVDRRDSTLTIDGNKVPRFSLCRGSGMSLKPFRQPLKYLCLSADFASGWCAKCEHSKIASTSRNSSRLRGTSSPRQ